MNIENQNVEYKESWRDEYLKWICGFANAQGGKICVGVDDEGFVVGLGEKEAHRLSEEIPNKVQNVLGIVVDVDLKEKDGKCYVEIVVEPQSVPISYKGQYHYRTGSTKQELKGIALQQFILEKMGKQWDDVSHETATLDDIDEKAIRYFVRKGIAAGRLSEEVIGDTTEEVLANLHLLDRNGKLKNAALLLFAKDPLDFFTAVQFKIGRFGVDEADLMFQDVVEGNILQMTDRVLDLLKSKYLISPIHYEGMQRKEPLEIPETAFREMIYNSIIHKLYSGPAIQMRIYADRIELWNDGELPEGYTAETLWGKHSSKPRNHNIADVFYKAGFIESWGRGFKKIREGFEKAGMKLPVFEPHCGGVLVTIFREKMAIDPPSNTPVTHQYPPSNTLVVFRLIRVMSEDYLPAKTLMKLLDINDIHHFRRIYLKPSVEAGLVEKEYPNNHPRQRYRLSKEGLDMKGKS